MKNKFYVLTLISLLLMSSLVACAQSPLRVGDKAPDFASKDQDGKKIKLSDYQGKKVVLYFYPKDNTKGCTKQACNLRDNIDTLTQLGYVVLGVSIDNEASHKDFIKEHSLPFTLIADVDKSINKKYGVWVEKERDGKKFWGTARVTFVIDEKGNISKIIDKVSTESHVEQILQ